MILKSLFFFDNGNVATFNEDDKQIPKIQSHNWIQVILKKYCL